jgi:hypothetical protein
MYQLKLTKRVFDTRRVELMPVEAVIFEQLYKTIEGLVARAAKFALEYRIDTTSQTNGGGYLFNKFSYIATDENASGMSKEIYYNIFVSTPKHLMSELKQKSINKQILSKAKIEYDLDKIKYSRVR